MGGVGKRVNIDIRVPKVEWERLKPIEFHHMRYIALGPKGQLSAWPSSRWRRALYALRGWHFVEDSMFGSQPRFVWWRTPEYHASVKALSKAEIEEQFGQKS